MQRFLRLKRLAFSLLTVLAIVACQRQVYQSDETMANASSDGADCRTIEHTKGTTEICGQPQRIVVLGPYVLEPLLALNIQPVGYADHVAFHQGDYTDPSQQIPYLGDLITQPLTNVGLAKAPSLEAILKVKPDLILATETVSSSHYEMLSNIAPTLMFDYFDPVGNLQAIAQAINHTEQAEEVLTQTQQQIASAQETFANFVATYPRVAFLTSSADLQTLAIPVRPAGLCHSLVKTLGFQETVPPDLDKQDADLLAPISLEALPDFLNDADILIVLGHNFSDLNQFDGMDNFVEHQLSTLKQAWKKNAITQSLNASQADRVYFIPSYLCGAVPGPIGTELYLEELKEQLLSSD